MNQASPLSLLIVLLIVPAKVISHFSCPGAGFYPDPSSCTSFYRCVDLLTSHQFLCPTGTMYDQSLGLCNHQQLVECHLSPAATTVTSLVAAIAESISEPSVTQTSTIKQSTRRPPIQAIFTLLPTTSSSSDDSSDVDDNLSSSAFQTSTMKQSTRRPSIQAIFTLLPTTSPSSEESSAADANFSSGASQTSTKPSNQSTDKDRPTPHLPNSQAQQTTSQPSVEPEVNIPNEEMDPIFPPSFSTQPPTSSSPSSTPPSPTPPPTSSPPSADPPYSVSPTSIYPCTQPGYYQEVSSCREFYVCREVGPGMLSADRIFRCPDRYLFDTQTHLCQREHKVTCQNQPSLFYTILNYMVVQLQEEQMDQFFKQSLTLPKYRGRTSINQELPFFYGFYKPRPHLIVYH